MSVVYRQIFWLFVCERQKKVGFADTDSVKYHLLIKDESCNIQLIDETHFFFISDGALH